MSHIARKPTPPNIPAKIRKNNMSDSLPIANDRSRRPPDPDKRAKVPVRVLLMSGIGQSDGRVSIEGAGVAGRGGCARHHGPPRGRPNAPARTSNAARNCAGVH